MTANGKFTVALENQEDIHFEAGRMTIDKVFTGDLHGHSKGQMLSHRTQSGSAGYVAIEHVTGTLDGRMGTFSLQHSGTMHKGDTSQTVAVIPGSGMGELHGLSGEMRITIKDGKHSYSFNYSLEK